MAWWKFLSKGGHAKVKPSRERRDRGKTKKKRSTEIFEKPLLKMWLVNYQTMIRRYGGQRHPRLESYETLKARGDITEYKYLPPYSTTIYVSVRSVLESLREFHFFHLP